MTSDDTPAPRARGGASDRIRKALAASGARIERLRMTVLAIAGAAILLVAAVLWMGRAFTLDPTRRAVDELKIPAWAATSVKDETYGSRWCIGECRVRVRMWSSDGTVEDTERAYREALGARGWIRAGADTCVGGRGDAGCYTRDELYLELWVVPVTCEDRFKLCVGSEVTAVVTSQAALPRLAEDRRMVHDRG